MSSASITLKERVSRLEYWRDGNGAEGAEDRLQDVETASSQCVRKIDCQRQHERLEHKIDSLVSTNWIKGIFELMLVIAAAIKIFIGG